MVNTSLAIVVPTHRRVDLLRRCLASVTRHAPRGADILVVDDASPAAVASAAARRFPGVRVLRRERASGFAAAANAGIRATCSAVVELLNDDTEVQPGWAEAALRHFDDASIGAVAPLTLLWPDGACIDSAGDRYYLGGVARKRGHGAAPGPECASPTHVFGASASSAFYRRSALDRVGLFPEEFGSYFEDVDLAFRLQRGGYQTMFEPAARVLHHGSASHRAGSRRLVGQQSLNEERVFWRNMPLAAMARALPCHLAVLLGKAWRRWQEDAFWPFLWGRLRLLGELPSIWRHRRRLATIGPPRKPGAWKVDERWDRAAS